MNADNRRVDHLHGRVMGSSQRVHNLGPNARPPPANKAVVAGGIWPEAAGQIAPWCSGSQDPKDAIEDTAVVYTRHPARLVRQHWPDGSPLMVGEFIAHDSKLPVLALESRGHVRSQCSLAS